MKCYVAKRMISVELHTRSVSEEDTLASRYKRIFALHGSIYIKDQNELELVYSLKSQWKLSVEELNKGHEETSEHC